MVFDEFLLRATMNEASIEATIVDFNEVRTVQSLSSRVARASSYIF